MKVVGLVLLCVIVLGNCEPSSNLSDLLSGYFTALQINTDIKKLLECSDDMIISEWEKAVGELARVDWTEPISVLLGLTAFVQPAIDTIGMVEPCSKEEISQIYDKIKAAVENRENFVHRVLQNIALVTDSLKDFLLKWNANTFVDAGSSAGALVYWLFVI